MSKYFGIFNNSGDVQTAINESALTKPYVALVSGALDYNTLEPQSANYIGEWFDAGEGSYYFDLLDAESFSPNAIEIATSELYFNGDLTNMVFALVRFYDPNSDEYLYTVYIYPAEEGQSDGIDYTFYGEDTWEITELVTEQDGSAYVQVGFDGLSSFNIYDMGGTLSLNTINPVAPAGE